MAALVEETFIDFLCALFIVLSLINCKQVYSMYQHSALLLTSVACIGL